VKVGESKDDSKKNGQIHTKGMAESTNLIELVDFNLGLS